MLSELDKVSEIQEEVRMPSGYSLDAVVAFRGQRVGVEVDGPSHFVGRSRTPTGSTSLKRRQILALEDVCLLPVLYWEWDNLNMDERHKFLERGLSDAFDRKSAMKQGTASPF